MLNPVIYAREFSFKEEQEVAKQYFPVYNYVTEIPKSSLVIPRYSFLPFGRDLERDIKNLGSTLINSYKEHQYVANIQNWYPDLEGETPQTWFSVEEIPYNEEGPFVVKGRTNSKKHDWATKMFASSRKELGGVIGRLLDDAFISEQGIVIRKYMPLETLTISLNNLPITKEYRHFILNDEVIGWSFYWANHREYLDTSYGGWHREGLRPSEKHSMNTFVRKVVDKLKGKIPFYVVDVAKTQSGEWILIELNDGTMSGLSCIDPHLFYSTLKERLNV